jgi:hypothetical protein
MRQSISIVVWCGVVRLGGSAFLLDMYRFIYVLQIVRFFRAHVWVYMKVDNPPWSVLLSYLD